MNISTIIKKGEKHGNFCSLLLYRRYEADITEEIHTTSEVTAQMVCAELVAKGREAWVEQVQ